MSVTYINRKPRAKVKSDKLKAFRVLAMVDFGQGKKRIAFLHSLKASLSGASSVCKNSPKGLSKDLPHYIDGVKFVYACQNRIDQKKKANSKQTRKKKALGRIIPDVLVPGDVVVVKKAYENKETVVKALRRFPL